MDECKPLPSSESRVLTPTPDWLPTPRILPRVRCVSNPRSTNLLSNTIKQGLTLIHFSAQLKRILWNEGAFRGCSGGVWELSGGIKEYQGVFRVYFVSETAQVELGSGRVSAPAFKCGTSPLRSLSTLASPSVAKTPSSMPPPSKKSARPPGRGLHLFTLELNLSNSRTHPGLSWVTRWTEELKLS